MREDPLSWFVNEKVAADPEPQPLLEDDYKIPHRPSLSAFDPGERAMAGITSVSSSLATAIIPMVGRALSVGILERKDPETKIPRHLGWNATPLEDASSIRESLSQPLKSRGGTARPLGLFDIEGRPRPYPGPNFQAKIMEIQPVVDSFIDKHNLKEKGVTLNIRKGPLSSRAGGGFSLANKRVTLPSVGKELALHELGHAADYTKGLGKVRRFTDPILKKSVLTALPIAMVAGDRIKEMIPGTVDDKAISFMQDHAPEIMAATLTATTLIPEAKASILAVKHLREMERAGQQPAGTAMKAAKRLAPFWGTYLLGAIPAVVGMSLARKYMREARAEKEEAHEDLRKSIEEGLGSLEKTSGDLVSGIKDLAHVSKQIGRGVYDLATHKGTLGRIGRAAKETGTSPEFVWGAMNAALPATMGALYMYGTEGGSHIRSRLEPGSQEKMLEHSSKNILGAANMDEAWREKHPLRFAGMVAAGAALSGGIMSKFIHDLMRVL